MGASMWSRTVPYQAEIGAALERARQEAYDEGAFYRQAADPALREIGEEEYVAQWLAEEQARLIAEFGDDAWEPGDDFTRDEWRAAQIDVTGPDTLLASQPFSGTHSIIDITGVSEEPEGGCAAPYPRDELIALLGTDRPSAAAVAGAVADQRLEGFYRWAAAYVISYADDKPHTIHFFGHSGD